MRSNRFRALFFALAVSATAEANTTPETVEQAKALYVEGKQLREQGDLKKSLAKLEAAHALYATPITALEVGRAYALVGQLTKAVEVLGTVERMEARANESKKAQDARAEAKALLARYTARLGTLSITFPHADTRILVDGAPVPDEAIVPSKTEAGSYRATWAVDPGPHVVSATQAGRELSEDVRLGEGEERTVTFRFPPTSEAPAPASSIPAVSGSTRGREPPKAEAPRTVPALAWVGFGVGAVGIATGAVTGIMTLSRASDLRSRCTPAGECLSSAGLGEARTLGTVSTVAFVVGGAGVALGVASLLFLPRANASKNGFWLSPAVNVAGAGLVGGATWR